MLEDLGFIRLFGDVKAWSIGSRGNGTESFEDWWVHPGYFDTDLIDLKSSNLYSFELKQKIFLQGTWDNSPCYLYARKDI